MKTNLFRNIKLPLLGRGLGGGLLLWCCPMVLTAQEGNGITVAVSADSPTTITFEMRWESAGMPEVWSDTIWVWVDYNQNGKMERLPVTGATASAGTITKVPGNDKGVWLAGNARDAGTFSATVQLFTDEPNVGGLCVYASSYPPVGKYISSTEISFTGTPPYDIILKANSGGTETHTAGSSYTVPTGYTVQSFTDKTSAPGIMGKPCTTAPGSTVDFEAFDPDPEAAIGTTWNLTDTREGGNSYTYKVRKMPDGHIWMVQDLQFGDCPDDLTHWNDDKSEAATASTPTVHDGYVGHCRSTTYTDGGFLYNWPATMQNKGAYYGGTYTGCSGTITGTTDAAPGACQGICPEGWHVPSDGEFYTLQNAMESGVDFDCSGVACWTASSQWEGMFGGYCRPNGEPYGQDYGAAYWTSSTYYSSSSSSSSSSAYILNFYIDGVPGINHFPYGKDFGVTVRCVRNY
jgi:uncharacterized protein (TIGR02145 family)